MNHVLQAAGRVIRRDDDYGVVVLIDDRYVAEPYLSLYPDHWEQISSTADPMELYDYLAAFWKKGRS
jgi:Rad3-related DNA helicase